MRRLIGMICWIVLATLPLAGQTPAGTSFSYQGRLTDGGAPANGVYDLRFTLFDAAAAGATAGAPVVFEDVAVTGGVFTVMLDFGANAFGGYARWLEIAVRPGASMDAFIALATRQSLTPAPHAIFSQTSLTSQSSVTSQSSQTSQSSDTTPWSGISGKPPGFADAIDNDALTALPCASAGHVAKWTGSAWTCAADEDAGGLDWKLSGNAATGGVAVLGTLDNAPLTLQVNGQSALRLLPDATSARVIGGHMSNSANSTGATIGGGGSADNPNVVTGSFGTVGGGYNNQAGERAVVGGGSGHRANALGSAVAGGLNNQATELAATVGGGASNVASGMLATTGGGSNNVASGASATVPGGLANRAAGVSSFAAGELAHADHDGAFVWADRLGEEIHSTASNQFIVRASGGVWFGTLSLLSIPAGRFINTSTGGYLSSTGTWTNASDRALKAGFEPVDGGRLLDQLARLPITAWSYKANPGVRHIGPMAQDFQAIFGFGGDDKAISTIDPAGIALAAIKELHRRLDAQTAALAAAEERAAELAREVQRVDALTEHTAALEAQLTALQALVRQLQSAR